MLLTDLVTIILNDATFVKNVSKSLEIIMKDGKVDINDAPEMVLLIAMTYNSLNNFHVSKEELPTLLSALSNAIIDKYQIVPKELRLQFDTILQSSISLVLLDPKVSKGCMSCCGLF